MHPVLKRALNWIGSALALTGIAFVTLRLYDYGAELNFARLDLVAWSTVVSLALIYGLSNLMLAFAWWNLLRQFGANTSCRWAVWVYGISQIARYMPGNIFHLAGRQAIGLSAGVPGWPLAKSAAWELGLISTTGGLFILLTLPLLEQVLPVAASAGIFAAVIGILAALLWRFIGPAVARAFGMYTGFLLISGFLFVGLFELLIENPDIGGVAWIPLCGAYVLAWLAGLVTPGAPAGMGVRELVLLFLLKGLVSDVDLLLAVILGRVVTAGGDVSYYFLSVFLSKRVSV